MNNWKLKALILSLIALVQAYSLNIPKLFSLRRQSQSDVSTKLKMAHMDSPSAQRNKPHIWKEISSSILPSYENEMSLQVLEVAAGKLHQIFIHDFGAFDANQVQLKYKLNFICTVYLTDWYT